MGENSDISLVNLLEKKAEKNPDFPLYTFLQGNLTENKILTYGELAKQAKKIAAVLPAPVIVLFKAIGDY
jgi:acyl-CoA synthetase (AMP-forming)/AMP-acid ligase II